MAAVRPIEPQSVHRTLVALPGSDDEEIRVYYTEDGWMAPSVTTITELRVDPEKDEALEGWRDRFDGQSSYARPWWKDQMTFKGERGTLAHFAMLSTVGDPSGDTYYHQVGDDDYGREEYEAVYHLQKWSTHAPSANEDDQRTPRNNQYDGEHAWDRAIRDISWCTTAFEEWWDDDYDVIDTERYVTCKVETDDGDDFGYGGQLDLLYEDDEGNVVCCDLKTSSGIRHSYKIQLAAYANAIEADVDRIEVARFHPDTETVEVEDNTDWSRSRDGLTYEFLALADLARQDAFAAALDGIDPTSF